AQRHAARASVEARDPARRAPAATALARFGPERPGRARGAPGSKARESPGGARALSHQPGRALEDAPVAREDPRADGRRKGALLLGMEGRRVDGESVRETAGGDRRLPLLRGRAGALSATES